MQLHRHLISLTTHERLDKHFMDVFTTYLYGSIDKDVFMNIPEGYKMPEAYNSNPQKVYSFKLKRSLYGLK